MISLIRIRHSIPARFFVWLVMAWLFIVVTEIDHFHNCTCLDGHNTCTDTHCHDESSDGSIWTSRDWLLTSVKLDKQASDCSACRLWSILSSSDLISLQFIKHNHQVSKFISSKKTAGSATALVVCFGRSPPVLSKRHS
jgi:hypothetical protein